MQKLLITGGSGFVGWNLCRAAVAARDGSAPRWKVHATVNRRKLVIPDVLVGRVELTDFRQLKALVSDLRPDAIIHTAAASQPNYCQEHPAESLRINTEVPVNLAGLAADREIPMVFLSSDLVFNGRNSPYREEDPVSPVSTYAEHKVQAELGVAERWPQAAICRMPLMFGDPGPVAASFIQSFLQSMRAGTELKLFTDEYRTPVSGGTAADGILRALDLVHGVIHLGGRERITRHDFGLLLADVLEISTARIVPCSHKDIPMAAPRPSDVALCSDRAYALGYNPATLREQIAELKGVI